MFNSHSRRKLSVKITSSIFLLSCFLPPSFSMFHRCPVSSLRLVFSLHIVLLPRFFSPSFFLSTRIYLLVYSTISRSQPSLRVTLDKTLLGVRSLFLLTLTRLWWHWRTHLSRLCFFPLFFFFSLWVGEELPNLLMERRETFACHDYKMSLRLLLNSAFLLITVLRRIALQRDHCWQRCHPVIAQKSPPPNKVFVSSSPSPPLPVDSFALELLFLPFHSQLTPTLSQENEK